MASNWYYDVAAFVCRTCRILSLIILNEFCFHAWASLSLAVPLDRLRMALPIIFKYITGTDRHLSDENIQYLCATLLGTQHINDQAKISFDNFCTKVGVEAI